MNSQVLKGFNDHFMELVEDIERVFPDDNDISTVKNSFIELRKANPKIIIKVFKEQFLDLYSSEIENGNIDFFINKDYKKDIGNMADSEYILKLVASVELSFEKKSHGPQGFINYLLNS